MTSKRCNSTETTKLWKYTLILKDVQLALVYWFIEEESWIAL